MRRLLIALLVLALLLLAPILALRSERVVLALAYWSIETFTDLRLVLKNPSIRPMRGLLSADEIHLYPKEDDGPPFLTVLDFSGRTDADDLWFGNLVDSDLSASQVTIYTSDRDNTSDPSPVQWLQYLGWLPRQLHIDWVHLVNASRETFIFPLKGVVGGRHGSAGYLLTAQAHYEGEPLLMEINLEAIREEQRFTRVDLTAGFTAPDSGSTLMLDGNVRGTIEDFEYDFAFNAHYHDVAEFLRGFQGGSDLRGQLTINAALRGNSQGYALTDARLVLDNMPEYGIEAFGELLFSEDQGQEIALVAAGELASLDYVVDWLQADVTTLGKVQASARISGSLDQPVIDEFILRSQSDSGLTVNVTGFIAAPAMREAQENEIKIDMQGPDLAVLEPLFGELPDLSGNWRASGRLHGTREQAGLDGLIIEIGTADTAKARVEGSIREAAGVQDHGLAALRGIELQATVQTPDLAILGELLEQPLPPYFEASARLTIAGDGPELAITGGSAQISSSDITLRADSFAGTIRGAEEQPLVDLQAQLQLQISDTSALSQYSESTIPALGPVAGTATLQQQGTRFGLEALQASIQGDGFTLRSKGRISDVTKLVGVQLDNQLTGLDINQLLLALLEDYAEQRALGQLQGQFRLTNPQGQWHATAIDIATAAADGPVELSLQGDITDLTGPLSASLAGICRVRDTALLESITGLPMNPLEVSAQLQSTRGLIELSGEGRVGDSQAELQGRLQHDQRALAGVELSFYSPHLYLHDFGLQAETEGDEEYRPADKLEKGEAADRLEAILARSPRYPSDIQVNIAGITGDNTNIQSLDVHITGVDNRYTLRRFTLTYADSLAEVRGIIDLNPNPPAISLAGQGMAIPMSTLGRDLGINEDIQGTVSIRGGLTAMGKSTEQLVSTLNGSVALALEDAVIEGAAYDVLATDFLAWIYSGAALESSTHIDCTMGQFLLQDGVASSDSLYVESRKMVATGTAEFDLVRQKMDVTITPRSKSRSLQVPSSVRLRGDFSNPRPTISPITAAADAYAQVITLVPKMVLRMFGVRKSSKGSQRPCEA